MRVTSYHVVMKILVTGGAGFIGANFIHHWRKSHPDDHIVNLDALTYAANRQNVAGLEGDPQYTFIQGDICDGELVARALDQVEVVVHFAAESHVDRSVREPASFVRTNVLGTQTLLEAALRQGVKRFHHVSTDEVFGALGLDTPERFNEETPYNPHSPYSASKAGSDHLVRAYSTTFGLPVTISNTSNNYGRFQFPEKLIPVLILKALSNEPLPIYGDGKNVRDWIHVEDHCAGIVAILEKGRLGETYCLGGNAEQSNLEIAQKILAMTGKPESLIQFVEDRPGHDRRYAIDSTKAETELGWQRRYTFEDGLAATVQWYTEHAGSLTVNEQGIHIK